MEYITIIVDFMKYLIEKHGLFVIWLMVASLITLYKLDMILTAVHLFLIKMGNIIHTIR